MVDLDPDWQEASEIIGFHVRVDGVLEGEMIRTAMSHGTIRYQGYGVRHLFCIIQTTKCGPKYETSLVSC